MRRLFSVIPLVLLLILGACAQGGGGWHGRSPGYYGGGVGTVPVRGYFRRDGTYVAPHFRSSPDGIRSNNLSYGRSRGGRR